MLTIDGNERVECSIASVDENNLIAYRFISKIISTLSDSLWVQDPFYHLSD